MFSFYLKCEFTQENQMSCLRGIKKGPITKSFTQKVCGMSDIVAAFHLIWALPEAHVSLINRFIYRNNYKYEGAFENFLKQL